MRKKNYLELQTLFAFFICNAFLYNIITILEFLAIRNIQLTSHCMSPKNEVVSDLIYLLVKHKYRIVLYFKNIFLLLLHFVAKNFRIHKSLAYGKKDTIA